MLIWFSMVELLSPDTHSVYLSLSLSLSTFDRIGTDKGIARWLIPTLTFIWKFTSSYSISCKLVSYNRSVLPETLLSSPPSPPPPPFVLWSEKGLWNTQTGTQWELLYCRSHFFVYLMRRWWWWWLPFHRLKCSWNVGCLFCCLWS